MVYEKVSKVVLANGDTLIDLTGDTVTAAHVLSGDTFHAKDGTVSAGTCTFDSDTKSDTANQSEILEGKTAHARGAQLTGTMANNGAVSASISTKAGSYVIPHGYHDGSGHVTLSGVDALIPANVRSGVQILDVVGTMSAGEGVTAQAKTATPTFAEQTIYPDAGTTYLSSVTVAAITVNRALNAANGYTVTIG